MSETTAVENAAIENIAGYRFVYLNDVDAQIPLQQGRCVALDLRGTILLAPEGINLFLAGASAAISAFLDQLRSDQRFADFEVKRSYSKAQPFARLKVKRKAEIVPLGVNNLDPNRAPAPRLSTAELRRWLDEGKEVVLLDTRNRFEFEQGSFDGAIDLNISKFRDFPEAAAAMRDAWADKPIVTFCTGGIRCEKAAPLLQSLVLTRYTSSTAAF
ncbi:hypothetical protein HC761_01025 [bacterium]|nr:hypothetical protein [bacterium]